MSDVHIEAPIQTITERPPMMGFMKSFAFSFRALLSADQTLESWEKDTLFRKNVVVQLDKFCGWISGISGDFPTRHGLNDEQLGRVDIRRRKKGGYFVLHEATQIEAFGNDKEEACTRLKGLIVTQLNIWETWGQRINGRKAMSLKEQAEKFKEDLIRELRQEFSIEE
jgi:hypothetical protein